MQTNGDGASATGSLVRAPHNTTAELGVLGGILLSPECLFDVAMILKPDDFYSPRNSMTYQAILELSDESQAIDAITVGEKLSKIEAFRWADINAFLEELISAAPVAAQTVYHAKIVVEKSRKRQLLEMCDETRAEVLREDGTADELLSRAEARVFAILDRDSTGDTTDAATAARETLAEFEAALVGDVPSIPTGFFDLDQIIHGFRPGQLIVVGARPGAGKSAFATSLIENWMTKIGFPILMVSLEMSRKEIMQRLTSSMSKIDGNVIKSPKRMKIRDEDAETVRYNLRQLAKTLLFTDDTPGRSITQIAANARRHRLRHRIEVLLIDYLQLIDPEARRGEARHEQVGRMTRRLKVLARELSIPVVLLAQVNRESEKRDDRRPRVAELRESGAIEQDADIVLMIHRPELADPADRPGEAELIVGKNRNGATGPTKLTYIKHLTRFANHAPVIAAPTHRPEDAPF